jgi:hypothetical protein
MEAALEPSGQFQSASRPSAVWHPSKPATAVATSGPVLIAASLVLFAVTRLYIFFALEPRFSDVQTKYFDCAARVVDLRQVPYQANVEIEYPPLAWWAMYLPRTLDGRRITNPRDASQVVPVYERYRAAFRGEMLVCDLVSLALLIAIVWRRRPSMTGWIALAYVAATAILGHVLYDRLDAGLLMLIMLWTFCWTRSFDAGKRRRLWVIAAYVALGLGISYKLVPIVCVPFLLFAEFQQPRRWLCVMVAVTTLLLAACGPFLIQFLISGPGILYVFSYHAGRGIQFESLYSTAMMVGQLFGTPAQVAFLHGSYELTGDLAPLLKGCAIALQLTLFSTLGFLALRRGQAFDRRAAYRFGLVALTAAVVFSNVLSPQYFVWALPVALLLSIEALPQDSQHKIVGDCPNFPVPGEENGTVPFSETILKPPLLAAIIVCVAVATTWLFPYHYFNIDSNACGLIPMWPADGGLALVHGALVASGPARISLLAAAVLALRNFLYLAAVVRLGIANCSQAPGSAGVGTANWLQAP